MQMNLIVQKTLERASSVRGSIFQGASINCLKRKWFFRHRCHWCLLQRNAHREDADIRDDESYLSDGKEGEGEGEGEESSEDEEMNIDIWNYLHNEKIIKEVLVTTLYKQMILLSKALKQDDTHQAILHTVQKAREEEDMDFRKAFDS